MSNLKQLIESEIKKKLSKDETHPYHAHVSTLSYDFDHNDNFLTGYGKTKEKSKDMSIATNRIIANSKHYGGGPIDKEDADDVHAHEMQKDDVKFRVSKKAHEYIHDTHGHMNPIDPHDRDGYEMTHGSMPKLHFDWKKKTISHKDEM